MRGSSRTWRALRCRSAWSGVRCWRCAGAAVAGRTSCTPRRRGRWWPAAARGCPSRREKTSVSASHSCGNCSATCATGQWCWQSCSPGGGRRAARRGSVPVRGQRLGQRLGARSLGRRGLDGRRGSARAWAATRARANAATAASPALAAAGGLGDPAQGVGGELVVRLVEGVPAAVGEGEHLGGAAAAAGSVDPLLAGLDDALGDERVEVAADGGLGEAQPLGQVGGGGRAVVQDGAGDPVRGCRRSPVVATAVARRLPSAAGSALAARISQHHCCVIPSADDKPRVRPRSGGAPSRKVA